MLDKINARFKTVRIGLVESYVFFEIVQRVFKINVLVPAGV